MWGKGGYDTDGNRRYARSSLGPFHFFLRIAIGFIRNEGYFPTRSAARAAQG